MLSPGKFHLLVPTDLVENLRFRKSILAECMKSAKARELIWHACSQDIIFWINVFCWQTNPLRLNEEDGPFICYDFQREAILNTVEWVIVLREFTLWEKSRMQGGTFMMIFIMLWLTIFHRRKKGLMMSHSEKAVENSEDEDTLFGKIDFVLTHLPSWMQDGLPRTKRVVRMRKTKSQVIGTSTTVRTGVGGRAHIVGGDEMSKWQNAQEIMGTLKWTGPMLGIGTHYGIGGLFYDMCRNPLIHKIVLHWSMNPLFNRGLYRSDPKLKPHERVVDPINNPLPANYQMITDGSPYGGYAPGLRSIHYDKVCRESSARDVAMHWDIDPAGASRQLFSQHLIRDLILRYSRAPEWEGDIVYDPAGRFNGLRPVKGGPLRIWAKFLPHHEHTGRYIQPSIFKVGGDIGQGQGATPSCLAGGDALTGKKILEYAWGHPPQARPANFARIASAICHLLADPSGDPAQIIWDRTGPSGETFGKALVDLGFRHFYYWRDDFELNARVSDSPGWFATPESKSLLFEEYEDALRTGRLENPSENALKECLAFEYDKTGKIEHGEAIRSEDPTAGKLNHSDMAYADALMWKLMREQSQEREDSVAAQEEEAKRTKGGIPFSFIEEYFGDRTTALNPFRR